jgi:hypothetical protein
MAFSLRAALIATSSLALFACGEATDVDGEAAGQDTASPNVDGSPAKATGEGKEDAWNYLNDPNRMAQFMARDLVKKAADLPQTGQSANTPWPDTYWPTAADGINFRWSGDSGVAGFSPAEKYDLAFNGWTPPANFAELKPFNASSCTDTWHPEYYTSIGPLARFISENRGNKKGRDKVDSDDDTKIDECDQEDVDGVEWWWGLCHAWVPAALNEPEPIHEVTHNGVTFYPSDIKALLMQAYNRSRSYILGGRCNTKEPKRDETGRIIDDACRDTNAGAFHLIVTNMIGRHKIAIAEDRTYDYQVWNQPVFKYEITQQTEVDLKKALELINSKEADYSKINKDAKRFMDVKATLYYVTESHASKSPMVPAISSYTRTDRYHYLLELNDAGEILGGEWILGTNEHPEWGVSKQPDFLWFSTGPATDYGVPLDIANIRKLLDLSRAPIVPVSDEPTGPASANKVEQVVAVGATIPDNSASGLSESLKVERTEKAITFAVQVDIKHTYISDLKIELHKDGTLIQTLWNKEGGSRDDIAQLFPVDALKGQSVAGEYTLKIIDGAADDEGTLVRWGLVAEVAPAE